MTHPKSDRLAYEEPDEPRVMTRDAVMAKSEAHLVRAASRLAAARSIVESAPNSLLQKAPRPVRKRAVHVSETAAKFAARLFD